MAPNPRKAIKRKVGKNPTLSMAAPTRGKTITLTKKFMVMYMEFTNAFFSVFSSCTVASITEVGAKMKKPSGSSTGKIQNPSSFRKRSVSRGVTMLMISRVLNLPILSLMVPAKRAPMAPANWRTVSASSE